MTELEQQVERLIEDFEQWFTRPVAEVRNEPIVRSEKAILKTFLWWVINLRDGVSLPGVVIPTKEKANGESSEVRNEVL
jgi:hypothetical protein